MPCRIVGAGGTLSIALRRGVAESLDWEVPLPPEGRVELPTGTVIEIRRFDSAGHARAAFHEADAPSDGLSAGPGALLLPLSSIRLPLSARSWRKGDRLRPRGLNGSKKLQDIFVDRKIPAARRWSYPVIVEAAAGSEVPLGASAEPAMEPSPVLGVLGVQGGETSLPIGARDVDSENIGPCLLILALSDRGIT